MIGKRRLKKVIWRYEELALNYSFWERVRGVLAIIKHIYSVLRMVDNEVTPSMRSLYASIQMMKDAIQVRNPKSYQWVHKIIDDRWEKTLSHPLHKAGMYLNHSFTHIYVPLY